MPLIYSVVARGSTVLAEFATTTGTFSEITRRLLAKIPSSGPSKMSYLYDQYTFHYVIENSITFLCMADQGFGRGAFIFLDDIKHRWEATYGDRGKTAPALGMNADFSRTLKTQMEYYNSNPAANDKLKQVKDNVDEIKGIMSQNIENLLERGDRIELLVDKTQHLENQSLQFRKSSNKLKWYMITKNIKLTIMLVCILILVAYFIAVAVCGGLWFQGCIN